MRTKEIILILAVSVIRAAITEGADYTWSAAPASSSWNLMDGNWTGGGAVWGNGAADNAVFGSSSTKSLNVATVTVNNITFNASGYTLNAGAISMSANGGFFGSSDAAINSDISSAGWITKDAGSSNVLTLGGNNSFSNGFVVNGGNIRITGTTTVVRAGNALYVGNAGSSNNGMLTLEPGGRLNLNNGGSGDSMVVGRDGGTGRFIHNGGYFNFNAGATLYVSANGTGQYDMNGGILELNNNPLQVGFIGNGVMNISAGSITNAGSLAFDSSNGNGNGTVNQNGGVVSVGSLAFGSMTNKTGSGTYNLNGGTLIVGSIQGPAANGTNNIFNFNGGVLKATGTMRNLNAARVKAGGAIIDTGSYGVTIAQGLADGGGGGLTKLGSGTLALSGTNTYTGPTIINGGTLKLMGPQKAPAGGAGLKLWLDASDLSTVVTNPPGYVQQWTDKSASVGGGGSGTVSQAGSKPMSGVDTINGLNVLKFDGTGTYLGGNAVLASGDNDYTYFAVWKSVTTNTGSHVVFEQSGAGNNARASLLGVNATYGFCGENNDNFGVVPFSANELRVTSLEINNALFDSTNNLRITDNGRQYSARTGSPVALAVGTAGTRVGAKQSNNAELFNGDIAEILVYDSILSLADRLGVECYLNYKWAGLGPANNVLPVTSVVVMTNGATLDLGGTDQALASLTGGGIIANGGLLTITNAFSPGVMNIDGSLALTNSSLLSLCVNSTNDYSRLTLTNGTVSLGSASLSVNLNGGNTVKTKDKFWIIDNKGASPINGTFKNGVIFAGGIRFVVYYTANYETGLLNGGNDVALSAETQGTLIVIR